MKSIVLSLFVVALGFSQDYTKTIEKQLDFSGQAIDLDVAFAKEIMVETWSKNEVYLKAEIAMEKESYIALYQLDIAQNSSEITIKEDTEALFKALKDEWKAKSDKKYYGGNMAYEFKYTLKVPANTKLTISSINGSLTADELVGKINAQLINGDITVEKYQGTLSLSTINGAIELSIGQSQFTAETINGNIYADKDINMVVADTYVGQQIRSESANNPNKLKLNTVNGDMYLKK